MDSNHSAHWAGLSIALASRDILCPLWAAAVPGRKYDQLLTHAEMVPADGTQAPGVMQDDGRDSTLSQSFLGFVLLAYAQPVHSIPLSLPCRSPSSLTAARGPCRTIPLPTELGRREAAGIPWGLCGTDRPRVARRGRRVRGAPYLLGPVSALLWPGRDGIDRGPQ